MARPTYKTINLSALQHNFAQVRHLAPRSKIMAMVKANAYGHGIVCAAKALAKADALGVASIDEGLLLREAGIKTSIVLMEGLFEQDEIELVAKHQFQFVIHHLPQIEMLEQAKLKKPVDVWLKINTGMNRLGIKPQQLLEIGKRLQALPAISSLKLMTHFAEADNLESQATSKQQSLFDESTKTWQLPKSLANSAGILGWPASHADWVRPGLMLYGASPFSHHMGSDHGLKPVMTFWSRIIALTDVQPGERIGYGGTHTAKQAMRVAVVGVGYGDGYPQFAQNGTPVLVDGVECALVGRVSMDMITVDVTALRDTKVGDVVTLWGEGLSVERVARCAQTSAYEVLTRMTARPRVKEK